MPYTHAHASIPIPMSPYPYPYPYPHAYLMHLGQNKKSRSVVSHTISILPPSQSPMELLLLQCPLERPMYMHLTLLARLAPLPFKNETAA